MAKSFNEIKGTLLS